MVALLFGAVIAAIIYLVGYWRVNGCSKLTHKPAQPSQQERARSVWTELQAVSDLLTPEEQRVMDAVAAIGGINQAPKDKARVRTGRLVDSLGRPVGLVKVDKHGKPIKSTVRLIRH